MILALAMMYMDSSDFGDSISGYGLDELKFNKSGNRFNVSNAI